MQRLSKRIRLIVGQINTQYNCMNIDLDLPNYSTKTDFKIATGIDTSSFAQETDFTSLISNVDKLDIDKLKNVRSNTSKSKSKEDKLDADKLVPVPVYLSRLSDVVKHEVTTKDAYNAKIQYIGEKHLTLLTQLLMFFLMLK